MLAPQRSVKLAAQDSVQECSVVTANTLAEGRPYLVLFGSHRPQLSWTAREVERHLLPERANDHDVKQKVKQLIAARTRLTLRAVQQPADYAVTRHMESRDDLDEMLQALMPGNWAATHITKLHNSMQRQTARFRKLEELVRTKQLDKLNPALVRTTGFVDTLRTSRTIVGLTGVKTVCTMDSEIETLLSVLNAGSLVKGVDPWAGSGTIARQLPFPVVSTDRNPVYWWPRRVDATQYEVVDMIQEDSEIDTIVTSPHYELLDVALCRLAQARCKVACVHVPGHYLSNMPEPRRNYFAKLVQERRVLAVQCRDIGPLGRRCAWLLIFRDAYWKQTLVKEYHPQVVFPLLI